MNTYQQRANLFSDQRAAIMRACEHAQSLAEAAQRRKDRAAVAECLDLLEALRETLSILTAQMTQLKNELEQLPKKEHTK